MNYATSPLSAAQGKNTSKQRRFLQSGETLSGFLFVSPMLIGVFILVLRPAHPS